MGTRSGRCGPEFKLVGASQRVRAAIYNPAGTGRVLKSRMAE